MAFMKTSALSSLQIWNSTILKVTGGILLMMGLVFLFPSLYAYLIAEDPSLFLYPVPVMLAVGSFLFIFNAPTRNFNTVNGIFLVIVVWVVLFVIGAIPYILAGMSPLNSIFESVSGFTTTGSSTIEDVHSMPESLMVWRSLTQWIGGIAVVLIFIYILPMFGMGRTFFSNELEGSGSSQLSMRLKNAASSFIQVYVGLTVINLLLLLLCNASVCDAICLSFTTISTGGVLVSNSSLIDMNDWIQIVTMVFMFIGGTNFYLHFKAIYGRNLKVYFTSREFRNILLWFFIVSVAIFLFFDWHLIASFDFDLSLMATDYKNALYTVVSLGTTTGSAIFDYTQYPVEIMLILLVVMLIGASAGSTSGGIKFTRMRVVLRFFNNTIKNVLHPNAIYSVSLDGETVDDKRVLNAVSITLLYFLTTFVTMIVLLSQGLNWQDSLGLAAGTISNTGVGFGEYGPLGSFNNLSDPIKIFLMFMMWVGRLEITLALVALTKSFWMDVAHSVRQNYRGKGHLFKKNE